MRIGIDARFYGPKGKGLGRYVSELLPQLERLDAENEYLIFLREDNFDLYQPQAKNFRKVLAEFPWYGWREQLIFPLWLRRFQLDLMHFAHFNVPLLYRRPFVVTIHDLILLSHPTPRASTLGPLLYRIKYWAYRLVIRRAAMAARRIITVSQFSRDEIQRHFPKVPAKKITVTYEGCAEPLRADSQQDSQTKLPGLIAGQPFALYVGSAYPHKNLERLVAAFAEFRQQGHPNWQLVLVGGGDEDYFYRRLRQEAEQHGWNEGLTLFGRATDEELSELYRQASFYVFPSLCEGFGLPPLEAMSQRLPVTAAAASCLPEVLNGAADWFDPESIDDIVAALKRMAADRTRRQELIDQGLRQIAKYDWHRCADQTLNVYRQAMTTRQGTP